MHFCLCSQDAGCGSSLFMNSVRGVAFSGRMELSTDVSRSTIGDNSRVLHTRPYTGMPRDVYAPVPVPASFHSLPQLAE